MLEPHSIAMHFPLLDGEEYAAFKADIAERGLLQPIWLYEGKILDGRNRYRACCDLGIQVRTEIYKGESPVGFSWSMNGQRRNLTHAQKAAIAVELLPELEAEAKKRMDATSKNAQRDEHGRLHPVSLPVGQPDKKGKATAEAAAKVGVSASSVQQAKAVMERDPAAFEQLKAGAVSVSVAYDRALNKAAPKKSFEASSKKERAQQIAKLSQEGFRAEQIAEKLGLSTRYVRIIASEFKVMLADAVVAKSLHVKVERVVEQTVTTLEGCALGIQVVLEQVNTLPKEKVREWAAALGIALKPVLTLQRKLLDMCEKGIS